MTATNEYISLTPISSLNISTRVYNQLQAAEISTCGHFLDALKDTSQALSFLTPKTIQTILSHISSLSISDGQTTPNWMKYAGNLNISLVPTDYVSGTPINSILDSLPTIINQVLDDERRWYIIERRFEFNGTSKLTLQDLGEAFAGITRQRIDQISDETIHKLKSVLIKQRFVGEKYRVHPEILESIQKIALAVQSLLANGIQENEIFEHLFKQFGINSKKVRPSLLFLFELAGFDKIEFGNSDLLPVWGRFSKKGCQIYKSLIPKIDKLLTVETVYPQKEFDVLRLINKSEPKHTKFTVSDIKIALRLCSTVERRDQDSFWGKLEYLSGRGNQAERLLIEHGKPMSVDSIVREINHRLIYRKQIKANNRNVVNQLSSDDRFENIGKSGHWGLRAREHIETVNIFELMEKCLITKNKPATVNEIYEYVISYRPKDTFELTSIIAILSTKKDIFTKHDRTHWKLTRWIEPTGEVWDLEQVAKFIEGFFKKKRVKVVDYKELKKALMETAGLTSKQADGTLGINPAVSTYRDEKSNIFAVFQDDYQQKMREIKTYGFGKGQTSPTLGDKISERVKAIIESSPNKQIYLSVLVSELRKEFEFRVRTEPYSYIDRLDFVEKLVSPDSNRKICRIREIIAFPLIQQISNADLQVKLKRAVGFLNLENVDIGLFLLSKEFEATLLTYLLKAENTGEIINPTPGKWRNFDEMIAFIAKEGIITDKAILNYLRQRRNDRAHGTMPSLDERKIMMNNVQSFANLYLDYIKFFDDLTRQL